LMVGSQDMGVSLRAAPAKGVRVTRIAAYANNSTVLYGHNVRAYVRAV